jgi:hypothetical protein
VIATAETQRKAAEVAQWFTGWTVWVTAQGSPVATRSGRQRPSESYDGNWAQTVMADDWDISRPNWQHRRSTTKKG